MSSEVPLVGVIMGSRSDWETMRHAAETLDALGVPYETRVVSAHRTPGLLFEYAGSRGARAAGPDRRGRRRRAPAGHGGRDDDAAGARRAGRRRARCRRLDSLLSIVQMPAGVPVGTLAIGRAGATNAALLAPASSPRPTRSIAAARARSAPSGPHRCSPIPTRACLRLRSAREGRRGRRRAARQDARAGRPPARPALHAARPRRGACARRRRRAAARRLRRPGSARPPGAGATSSPSSSRTCPPRASRCSSAPACGSPRRRRRSPSRRTGSPRSGCSPSSASRRRRTPPSTTRRACARHSMPWGCRRSSRPAASATTARDRRVVERPDEALAALRSLGGRDLLLEGRVSFARELSLVGVRGRDGEHRLLPAGRERAPRRHPATISRPRLPASRMRGRPPARRSAGAVLDGSTTSGCSRSSCSRRPMACSPTSSPRACTTRATGRSRAPRRGSSRTTSGRSRAAARLDRGVGVSAMVNLIGETPLVELLAGGGHVHLYGKAARPGRKLGHVTLRRDRPRDLQRPARVDRPPARARASSPRSTPRSIRYLEITEIADRAMKAGGPALLFRNVKGSPHCRC